MITITNQDFQKLLKLLAKEGQDGANLTFMVSHMDSYLLVRTVDRNNKEMIIEISDTAYPFMTRITRTETF